MKQMKKLTSILLALVMVLGLATTAMASGNTGAKDGSITITDAREGATYTAYKILDVTYSADPKPEPTENPDNAHYSYTIAAGWEDFFAAGGAGAEYIEFENGYVKGWSKNDADGKPIAADVAEFAKKALTYATDKKIAPAGSANAVIKSEATDTTPATYEAVISPLDHGYFVVDSSLGALCGLTTTEPTATIKEKNDKPSVDKKVKDGEITDPETKETSDNWQETNTASIGDIVKFKTTISAQSGATNYVLHDKMTAGLTFVNDNDYPVTVTQKGTPDKTLVVGDDYTLTVDADDDCDFEISFTQTYLDTITEATEIEVIYYARLNESAVIKPGSNDNDTWLGYGENSETEHDTTHTYTFKFDLIKTDDKGAKLEDAEFKLYDTAAPADGEDNRTAIPFVKITENGKDIYRVATPAEIADTSVVKTETIVAGQIEVRGLGNGTYYLKETKAPAGYNLLATETVVTIANNNVDLGTLETDTTKENYGHYDTGIQVINKTGTELPETGGIGTTIFYTVGGVLVVAAIVLLVTKKRMGAKD